MVIRHTVGLSGKKYATLNNVNPRGANNKCFYLEVEVLKDNSHVNTTT